MAAERLHELVALRKAIYLRLVTLTLAAGGSGVSRGETDSMDEAAFENLLTPARGRLVVRGIPQHRDELGQEDGSHACTHSADIAGFVKPTCMRFGTSCKSQQ